MQAIILVGGLGTRLRSVLHDVPKPMAPIDSKPFLAYLLDYLHGQGITKIIFSVHYLREKIQSYFGDHYHGMDISYAIEAEPLGTGGAILNALSVNENPEPVFILNGDTFVKVDYKSMYERHLQSSGDFTMALRAVNDCSRYGKVVVEQNIVTQFKEKGETGQGYINAGVYLVNPQLFSQFDLPSHFSLEKDFLLPYLPRLNPQAFIANDYFIDIGIPEDYARAKAELPVLAF